MRDGGGGSTTPPIDRADNQPDGAADILYLVDRLEELVGIGKRVPFSTRVMIEEEDFLAIVDQLRDTVPNDVRQAQRVIREREAIVAGAQAEASKILEVARQQAEYIVSQQGVLNEARQRGEELLRQVELEHRRSLGQIDQYALQQFTRVEDAVQQALQLVMDAVRDTTAEMEAAKRAIGS